MKICENGEPVNKNENRVLDNVKNIFCISVDIREVKMDFLPLLH